MELRKDYIQDRFVLVSNERSKRPFEFNKDESKPMLSKDCFFCPGNENLTPPEIGRVSESDRWKIRWFNNKFAAVKPEGNHNIRTDNNY